MLSTQVLPWFRVTVSFSYSLRRLGIRDLEDNNSILAEKTPLVVNILFNLFCNSFLQIKLFNVDFASAQEVVFGKVVVHDFELKTDENTST